MTQNALFPNLHRNMGLRQIKYIIGVAKEESSQEEWIRGGK
jgi:hypothetical protein